MARLSLYAALLFCGIAAANKQQNSKRTTTTLIPSNVFDDYTIMEEYFSYLYPWGSDHNGAARMVGNASFHEFIFLSNTSLSSTDDTPTPTLNLMSVLAPPGQPPSTNAAGMNPTINYFSGTVHATQNFTVEEGQELVFEAEVVAPVILGTWPAFWLTAVIGWPPEADLGEWKGDGLISFNTFNTSSIVDAENFAYPNPDDFHTLKAILTGEDDGSTVAIQYFLDGTLMSTQYGSDFIGAALWLIIDLQMEGSSGSPGPTGSTLYQIRNLSVTQTV